MLARHPLVLAFAAIGVLVAAAVVWRVVDMSAQQGRGFGPRVTPVVVSYVQNGVFADTVEVLGTAQANESIEVSAKVTEKVQRLTFTDGQTVQAGAIIVELTDAEEVAQLEGAQAALEEAQAQFERVRDLVAQGTASTSRLDSQRALRDEAASRLAAVEARVADRVIRAPFAGVVGIRQVSPGKLVQPGDVITTLDDISVIKLDFSVPETFLGGLAPGQVVEAAAAAFPGQRFMGSLATVSPRVDPVTRAGLVRALIPNERGLLKPGMLLSATLRQNAREALMVPEGALIPVEDRQYVYRLVGDEQVVRHPVEVGRRRAGLVEILDGLTTEDRVVVEGTNRIGGDFQVKIIETRGQPGAPPQAADASVPAGG